KRIVLPADLFACKLNFIFTEWRSMGRSLALFIGRTPADDRVTANEAGLVSDLAGFAQGFFDLFRIVTVNIADHVPAVGFKTFGGILGKPAADITIDRHLVAVEQTNQLAEFKCASQRRGFM